MKKNRDKLFYSPAEFRQILGCSRGLCYEALRQRKIRSIRFGKKYFIPAPEIDRLTRSAISESGEPDKVDSPTW